MDLQLINAYYAGITEWVKEKLPARSERGNLSTEMIAMIVGVGTIVAIVVAAIIVFVKKKVGELS